MPKIGFLYEHPTWSDSLIECFSQNDIDLRLIRVHEIAFDTASVKLDLDMLINRVNIMPSTGRDSAIVFHTLHYLNWLELSGVRIINGARAHRVGASKAMQNGIFAKLGLNFPRAIAIHNIGDIENAANEIGYPIIVKPNIGGSGSGIARFDSKFVLRQAVEAGSIDLGLDSTGLVQEYINSNGYVYRVEILGEALFYGIKQPIVENQFNYCAIDGCSANSGSGVGESENDRIATSGPGRIEAFEVPDTVVRHAIAVCREAGADVGGVEYLIRGDSEYPYFYDFNPYSNFVSNGEALLGFLPEQRYVDFILRQFDGVDTR